MELRHLKYFTCLYEEGSVTRAAQRLNIVQPALSMQIARLEEELGQTLFERSSKGMAPTEAGERLYQTVAPRLADIDAELAVLAELRGKPAGTVRISASEHAARQIVWPRLQPLLAQYPDIELELSADNRMVDIVEERFDMGVRLGDDVARDMIAVRIAPDMRMAVVGSPAYFSRHAPPAVPQDLTSHACIGMRLPTRGGLLPWEFMQGGKLFGLHLKGPLVFNHGDLILAAALAGHGLAWQPQDMVAAHIESGHLHAVLDDYAAVFPGYHLDYASRRASPAIALVVEALRLR